MIKNKISIIIVTWNGLRHLQKCLPSIVASTYQNFEIVLVDNASSDGSIEFVEKKYPNVKIVRNQTNLGFAEANNIGFENSDGEYVFLLNNDTTIEPDCLEKLMTKIKENETIGGIQPKILRMDEPEKLDCVGDFPTISGIFEHYGLGGDKNDPRFNKTMEIFAMKGAAMFVPRKIIEKVGLFDSDFFAYFEETDFCHRIWLAGYKIIYYPGATVYHKGFGTSHNLSFGFIQEHAFKNRICSFLKNFGMVNLLKILPLHLVVCEFLAVFYSMKRREFKFFTMIQRAIWWNIKNFKKTLRKRKNIQTETRKIRDNAFLPMLMRDIALSEAVRRLFCSFTFKN
jgi:GT2 family glycosyltransferase